MAARQVGLQLPATLISYTDTSITDFFRAHDHRIVAKAVRHGFVRAKNGLLLAGTQRLSPDFPLELSQYAAVPMTYQEEIEKKADIRVVVVGEQVFATEITVEDEQQVDWRLADLSGRDLVHKSMVLPDVVAYQCIELVQHFGLNYSSLDLVEDCRGNFYFLELNPNGQWAWIEQITGVPIRDAIIDALLGIGS